MNSPITMQSPAEGLDKAGEGRAAPLDRSRSVAGTIDCSGYGAAAIGVIPFSVCVRRATIAAHSPTHEKGKALPPDRARGVWEVLKIQYFMTPGKVKK